MKYSRSMMEKIYIEPYRYSNSNISLLRDIMFDHMLNDTIPENCTQKDFLQLSLIAYKNIRTTHSATAAKIISDLGIKVHHNADRDIYEIIPEELKKTQPIQEAV